MDSLYQNYEIAVDIPVVQVEIVVNTKFTQDNAVACKEYLLKNFIVITYGMRAGSNRINMGCLVSPQLFLALKTLLSNDGTPPPVLRHATTKLFFLNSTGHIERLTIKSSEDLEGVEGKIEQLILEKKPTPHQITQQESQQIYIKIPAEIAERFNKIAGLKRGWDGEDAEPIYRRSIDIVFGLVAQFIANNKVPPKIYASPTGAVDLEWESLYIIIYPDEALFPQYTDLEYGEDKNIDHVVFLLYQEVEEKIQD